MDFIFSGHTLSDIQFSHTHFWSIFKFNKHLEKNLDANHQEDTLIFQVCKQDVIVLTV